MLHGAPGSPEFKTTGLPLRLTSERGAGLGTKQCIKKKNLARSGQANKGDPIYSMGARSGSCVKMITKSNPIFNRLTTPNMIILAFTATFLLASSCMGLFGKFRHGNGSLQCVLFLRSVLTPIV